MAAFVANCLQAVEAVVKGDGRFQPCDVELQTCNFCFTTGLQTTAVVIK